MKLEAKWRHIEAVGDVELAELAGAEALGSACWGMFRTESMVPPKRSVVT